MTTINSRTHAAAPPVSQQAAAPPILDGQLDVHELAARIEAGHRLTREEALAVLRVPDAATHTLVAAAGRLRQKFFGNTVKVNYLVNLKSGSAQKTAPTVHSALAPRPKS